MDTNWPAHTKSNGTAPHGPPPDHRPGSGAGRRNNQARPPWPPHRSPPKSLVDPSQHPLCSASWGDGCARQPNKRYDSRSQRSS